MSRLAPEKRHVKGESQWEIGVFVGMRIRTSEFLVVTVGEFFLDNKSQKEPRSCVRQGRLSGVGFSIH